MSNQKKKVAVVCVAFDESGDDAIRESLQWLSEGAGRVLHALYVVDPSDIKENVIKPALVAKEEALEKGPGLVGEWVRVLAEKYGLAFDERVHTHVRIGKVADTALQVAIDYDADVIIAGTHGRRGLDRMLLGSVAEQIIRGARCPVLIARPKNYTDAAKTTLPDLPYPVGQEPAYRSTQDVPRSVQTESDIWRPTGGRPTGFRIV